jgi:hypothetical protein
MGGAKRPATKATPKPAAKKAAAKKSPAKKASTGRKATAKKPTHAQIAERAYQIHQAEGGDHMDNWLRAERELQARK